MKYCEMLKQVSAGAAMKFLKAIYILFSMFFFSSNAFAVEAGIGVSGPDILVEGACYSATGGTAPYLWTASEGSIDDSGCVSGVPVECGNATITVSDDCRVKGSKGVTLCPPISGSDAPSNGSCYAANNAVGDVQWSITKGVIDNNGCVGNISRQCGTATITATDASGNTSTRDVRMPNGKWVLVSNVKMCATVCSHTDSTACIYIEIIGNMKYEKTMWKVCSTATPCNNEGCPGGYGCDPGAAGNGWGDACRGSQIYKHVATKTHEWRCP